MKFTYVANWVLQLHYTMQRNYYREINCQHIYTTILKRCELNWNWSVQEWATKLEYNQLQETNMTLEC